MAGGRPLKFETVEELQAQINDYFKVTSPEEYAITGLAVHLGTDRATLINYEGRPEFFNTVKDAKNRIELAYEKRLIKRGNAGDIFALKNFDWRDKNESEVYGKDGGTIDQTINVKFVNGGTNTTKVSGFIPTEQV